MSDRALEFVDTNILIYAHDVDAGDRHWRAKEVVSGLWDSGDGMISTQVLNEFYVNVTQKIPSPMEPARARAVIEAYLSWNVQTPDPESVLIASEIQQRYRISYWDALIVHAASKGGASVLYTEDLNAGQVMEGVQIVNPLLDSAVHDATPTVAPIERGEQGDFEQRARLGSTDLQLRSTGRTVFVLLNRNRQSGLEITPERTIPPSLVSRIDFVPHFRRTGGNTRRKRALAGDWSRGIGHGGLTRYYLSDTGRP